jgi:hypothetical protein
MTISKDTECLPAELFHKELAAADFVGGAPAMLDLRMEWYEQPQQGVRNRRR